MKFEPKTEDEVQEAGLLAAGEYDFEVAEASDEVSKKDNEMIKLKLRVYNSDGGFSTVFDYLLESVAYKLRHFAFATGIGERYESGALVASDCEQKTGRCKIATQPAKDGYAAKNVVRDYITTNSDMVQKAAVNVRKAQAPLDDDIPF